MTQNSSTVPASSAPAASAGARTTKAGIARNALAIGAGVVVLAIAAQLAIPFKPVPVTMQTLAVVLVGWALGGGRSLAAVSIYGAMGVAGLPILSAGTAGISPSTGYLLGFIVSAVFVGWMQSRQPLAGLRALAVFAVALAIPYIPGLIWLSAFTGMGAPWSAQVLAAGMTPFIPGDILKLVAAAAVATGATALRR